MTTHTRGVLEMSTAMIISGTIGWFVVHSGQPVIDVVFWRCAIGAPALLAVCAALGLLRGRLTLRLLAFAALGGMAIVLNWLLLFAAYPRASIAIATAVYNTQPFMLVALGALFLSEKLTAARLGWLALAFVGMLLIVQAKPGAGAPGSDHLAGIALALGAAFFYALAALVAKKLAGTPPHLIALIQVCVGTLMLAPFVSVSSLSSLPGDARTWTILLTLGIVHTGLMYILLYGAIQKLPTPLTGALSFIYPVVAIVVDVLAFDHYLRPLQLLGIAGILFAAAGMTLGWSWRSPWGSRVRRWVTRSRHV